MILEALLIVSLFQDRSTCTVQGHVYRMVEADPVDFKRTA